MNIKTWIMRLALIPILIPCSVYALSTQGVVEIPEDMINIVVDESLVNTVNESLPEYIEADQIFLRQEYNPVLPLAEDSNISVTFISEGTGNRNSLGWFAWGDSAFDGLSKSDIDTDGSGIVSLDELISVSGVDAGWVFPNASSPYEWGVNWGSGQMSTGDTLVINSGETFQSGTTVSFFLGADAWDGSGISGVNSTDMIERNMFYGLDFLNPEALGSSTIDSSQSGVADDGSAIHNERHVAMLFADDNQDQIILGFEDLIRPDGDNDFNDVVFTIEASAADAFSEVQIVTAPLPEGVSGYLGILFLLVLMFITRKEPVFRSQQDVVYS